MHKLIVIGTVVAALGVVGPAFGKPALPEGYQLPSAQPGVWAPAAVQALGLRGEAMARHYEAATSYTPQAVQALGERGQAMGRFYGTTIVSSQLTNQRQLERLAAIDAHQRQVEPVAGGLDANQRQVEPSQPVVVSGEGTSVDWRSVGIGAGTAALIAALGLAGVLGIRVRSTVAHP
jgi:hypothetical protein